jgi:hypothetical protein
MFVRKPRLFARLPEELSPIAFIRCPERLFEYQLADGHSLRQLHSEFSVVADFQLYGTTKARMNCPSGDVLTVNNARGAFGNLTQNVLQTSSFGKFGWSDQQPSGWSDAPLSSMTICWLLIAA